MLRLARQLRASIMRPTRDALRRSTPAPIAIPDEVLLLPDGTVIAAYEGEPLLRYKNLLHLLDHHGLSESDLEEANS